MQPDRERNAKKAYHRPELKIYGDIRKLTETSTTSGQKNDGGGQGYSKAKTG